jgi:hypothetical protein
VAVGVDGKERESLKVSKKLGIDFIKTTYDISLDSQISLLPLGFSPFLSRETTEQPYEL